MDRRQSETDQIVVDDAEIVAVEIAPDDRDEGRGDNDGQKIGQTKQIEQRGRHRAIERERKQHADADIAGHGEDRETQRVPEYLQRTIVGEKALKLSRPTQREPAIGS